MKKMKTTLSIICIFAAIAFAQAQKVSETDVPQVVKSAFKTQCPAIASANWEKEDGNFEAHYVNGKNRMTCVISPSGTYVQSETEISGSGLPKAAFDYLAKKLPRKKITEVAKITDAKGNITFEAEVNDVDYTFDSGGKFLKQDADND